MCALSVKIGLFERASKLYTKPSSVLAWKKIKDRQDQANMIETLSNGHTVEITVKINYVSDSSEDLIKN